MYKWEWNGYITYAATYAAAKRNITWQAFGRRLSPYRKNVDPVKVEEAKK